MVWVQTGEGCDPPPSQTAFLRKLEVMDWPRRFSHLGGASSGRRWRSNYAALGRTDHYTQHDGQKNISLNRRKNVDSF